MASWPTTATALGVRMHDGNLTVLSAFGLVDLFGLVVRANRVQVPQATFEAKAARWQRLWPELTVIPWSDGIGIEAERVVKGPAL